MSDQIGFWTGGSSKTMGRAPTLGFGHTPYHVRDARKEAGRDANRIPQTSRPTLNEANSTYACNKCGFRGDTRRALEDHRKLHDELNGARNAQKISNRAKITKKTLAGRVFEGKLWKRGGIRKNWKRRYFRLGANARAKDGSFLFAYYLDQASSRTRRPLGVIDLRGATCRPSRRRPHRNKLIDDPAMFHFEINTPGRTYEMSCSDEGIGRDWIETIRIAIESAPAAYTKVGPARWSKRGSKPLRVVCRVPGCTIAWHNHGN